ALLAKVRSQRVFKATAKSHRRARFFFAPAVEVSVTIAAGAAEILADLRVAIDHRNFSDPPAHLPHRLTRRTALPIRRPVRTNPSLGKNAHSRFYTTCE